MKELGKLADRLDSGHDLEVYCDVLAFGAHEPGASDPQDAHRLLRKPLVALGAARDRLAERHADAYRGGKAEEEVPVIGTAALLDSDFRRRRPGRFRLPWQETWEEIMRGSPERTRGEGRFFGHLELAGRNALAALGGDDAGAAAVGRLALRLAVHVGCRGATGRRGRAPGARGMG
ncbi:hypothetical protein [Streptomyces erythrochromogenes]|uniref:hypothetical protein n=1 Tax=Streptomyces erythrochromogenes TaxID=285574 RepID=UPI0036779C8B